MMEEEMKKRVGGPLENAPEPLAGRKCSILIGRNSKSAKSKLKIFSFNPHRKTANLRKLQKENEKRRKEKKKKRSKNL